MNLAPDFRDLLEELARDAVEFLLVGGYAVAFHGRPRATKDIDIYVREKTENLARAARALDRFGAPPHVVAAVETMSESDVVYMGRPPMRVDFLCRIDGVTSEELFASAVEANVDGLTIKVISRAHLIINKRASGRPQDLVDADLLERAGKSRSSL